MNPTHQPKLLHCLLLNDQSTHLLSDPSDPTVAHEYRLLAIEGGTFVGPLGPCVLRLKHCPGSTGMALLREQGPVGSAVLAWDDSAAMMIWQNITDHHLQVCESFDLAAPDLAPIRPTALPWLAVSLTPTFLAANAKNYHVLALAILAGVSHAILGKQKHGNN